MIDAKQVRAARALLEWSQDELVKRSGLSLTTIRRMEDFGIGPGRSSGANVVAVQKALQSAGVQFIAENGGGAGVRLQKAAPTGQPAEGEAGIIKNSEM